MTTGDFMLGRLTAIAAVCFTAAVGFSAIATGDDSGAKAPLQPISSLDTPAVPVPDVPPVQTPDVAGVNVPDVPGVQTPDVPAVSVPVPGSSAPSDPAPAQPSQPSAPASQPSSSSSSSSTHAGQPSHSSSAQHSPNTQPHHADVSPAGTKRTTAKTGKSERVSDQVAPRRTAAAKRRAKAARVERMPRLQPTAALTSDSGHLIRVEAVTASSGASDAHKSGHRGMAAGVVQKAGAGWSAPMVPLLFLAGFALVAFTVMGNRVYAPSPAPLWPGGASDRPNTQTSERGDAEAADSSLGSTVLDVSPGDKVVAPGPPAVSAAAVTTTEMPPAAPARDDVQPAAGGDSFEPDPVVFTYTVRRRSGGLVGAARNGLRSLRERR